MAPSLEHPWRQETKVGRWTIGIETGRIARQADGAVLIHQGDTTLLVTAVAAPHPRPGVDFFPLTVEYRERLSAAGRFPGGYRKKEGRTSDREILACRLVDRTVRPLFPEAFTCETQVLATVLSFEPGTDPEVLAITGGAAALALSSIPFDAPVAGLRVTMSEGGEYVAFPDLELRAAAKLDLVISLGPNGLVMVEGEAKEASEEEVAGAIHFAQQALRPLHEMVTRAAREAGHEKRDFTPPEVDAELKAAVAEAAGAAVQAALRIPGKKERGNAVEAANTTAQQALAERFPDRKAEIGALLADLEYRLMRASILDQGLRADGRGPTDIRPIRSEVKLLPRVHGSALFTRGETQALVVTTLGTAEDEQEADSMHGIERERFQLHYSFPPYSVGEVKPIRGPGRREIGHGNLARRALEQALPDAERFPYTIKVESEITESNGSSSMATVCGGCLAMMDAGVPITRPVAGIAMGLILEGERSTVLSDILGLEDHLGDMDFKVAGTERGITAVQLDNKLGSLPGGLLERALAQAREGRLHILGEMKKALAAPRPDLAPHAPRVERIVIGTHRIRDLIGPGGRNIQGVQADTGVKIDVNDQGIVRIYANDLGALAEARRRVRDLTGEPHVGRYYRGTVTGVKEFGCFVRLFQGIEGLVHASELSNEFVREVGAVASEGETMVVKVLGVENGKISLSRKQALGVSDAEIEE
ncbi:MAG: polyribonucleotide nucleotidyltransferase [Candidatus Eisenbacteria bacterium]|nr:polyribonucleotide nucleotidyltransferase [Candidatus Eisenbacteria bacterium]